MLRLGVVVIVIATVVIGLVFFWPQISGGQFTAESKSSLPIFPGATDFKPAMMNWSVYWQNALPPDWSGESYEVAAERTAVAEWYKGNMSGWNMENETVFSYGDVPRRTTLQFVLGENAAVIQVAESGYTFGPFFAGTDNVILILSGPVSGLRYLNDQLLHMFSPECPC